MGARTLWLLRHAKTVSDPPDGGTDFDRVLAPRGRRDALALGRLFGVDGHDLGLEGIRLPEVALISPAARTVTTADLVLAQLAPAPEQRLLPVLYGAEPEDVIAQLRALPDEVRSVMVVGHNPTAHSLSQALIARKDKQGIALSARRGFPTCALGIYRFDVAHWTGVKARGGHLDALLIPPYGGTTDGAG